MTGRKEYPKNVQFLHTIVKMMYLNKTRSIGGGGQGWGSGHRNFSRYYNFEQIIGDVGHDQRR